MGLLVAVEGIDGSGKTTHINLLRRWLEERGDRVFLTEWNSSDLVRRIIRRGKKKNLLTPTTFSLLHATDFADRYERMIQPHLAGGYVVLCDRYTFTGRSRDAARGVHHDWVENLYSFARRPDVTFYMRVQPKVALSRLLAARGNVKWYESGMDLGLASEPEKSFVKFQQRVVDAYERLAEAEGFVVLDGTRPIGHEQSRMRATVMKRLESAREGSRGAQRARASEHHPLEEVKHGVEQAKAGTPPLVPGARAPGRARAAARPSRRD